MAAGVLPQIRHSKHPLHRAIARGKRDAVVEFLTAKHSEFIGEEITDPVNSIDDATGAFRTVSE